MTTQERIDFINELIEQTIRLEREYGELTKDIAEEEKANEGVDRFKQIWRSRINLGTDNNLYYLKDMQTFFKAEQYDILMTEGSNK